MTAEIIMFVGSITYFLLTLYWVRKRVLREKYAVCWMVSSVFVLVLGVFPDIVKNLSEFCGLSYPAFILLLNLIVFYLFAFGVSIVNSKQHAKLVRLTQELGLLEERVAELEKNS